MRKFVVSIIFLIFLSLTLSKNVQAVGLLPRFRSSGAAARGSAYSGVVVTPRFRPDRKALIIYFASLKKARSITYTLIYQTNGKDEGVRGSIDSSTGDSASRELLFGTCSAGVCRYHTNIKNMKLEVITELLSGKKTLKRFRIRV